ncbi:MAG: hypothetical protein Kow00129_03750 [Thermoleophilia bacterium]
MRPASRDGVLADDHRLLFCCGAVFGLGIDEHKARLVGLPGGFTQSQADQVGYHRRLGLSGPQIDDDEDCRQQEQEGPGEKESSDGTAIGEPDGAVLVLRAR